MVTLALLAVAIAQAPEPAEPIEAVERDLSITAELTGGGRSLGLSAFVDYGVVPETLYLSAGYALLKPPVLETSGTTPLAPAVTHVLSLGADWSVGRRFALSVLLNGSPRATDAVVLNPDGRADVSVNTWRSSLGGSLVAAWSSGGLSDFEWMIDAGASVTANRLGRGVRLGPVFVFGPTEEPLISARALAGLTVTLFDRTDLSLRGSVFGYSDDPLTVGRFELDDVEELRRRGTVISPEVFDRLALLLGARLGQADSLSGYASAPIWVETRLGVLHRFNRTVSAQVAWTFDRYVPTAGWANTLSARVTVKVHSRWRLWAGGAVQLDQPLDRPTPTDPKAYTSALGTVGVELTL